MVRIGIVGIGFMGRMHFLAAQRVKGVKVAAVCTRDPKKLKGDWRSTTGNYGPKGAKVDLKGVAAYREVSELLADPGIDLVDICLPTHLHPEVAKAALAAGKHVLVEKPVALETAEAKAMISAAKKADRRLMVAHILPFFPDWAWVLRTVQGGEYGRLRAARFRRIISRPDWSADIADPAKTGGPALDLHVHDTHFVQLLCGTPRQVISRGLMENGHVVHLDTQYVFEPDGPVVTSASGCLSRPGLPFTAGLEIHLERAVLMADSGVRPLTIVPPDGKPRAVKLPAGDELDVFAEEIRLAAASVGGEPVPPALSAEAAMAAVALCHKEIESVKSGKPVKV
jgi:predicted dehydrogenase